MQPPAPAGTFLPLFPGRTHPFHTQCGQSLMVSGDHPLMWMIDYVLAFT